MSLSLATVPDSPGLTPQIVRTPTGALALHVIGALVKGASVLGVGPDAQGKIVASVVIDMSKATFGEANEPLPTLPPILTV